jgi:integrase
MAVVIGGVYFMKNNSDKNSTRALFIAALDKKINSGISRNHKDNLRYACSHFLNFLDAQEINLPVSEISPGKVEQFLQQFNSSPTHYMNKRRDLGVLFNTVGKMIDIPLTAVKKTDTQRVKATLHLAYEKQQLQPVFEFIKERDLNLYRCCLMTYGCLLRPHEEIRLLTKKHFKENNTEIHLSGTENKGGRVRVVYVPDYVRAELEPIISDLKRDDNIFSCQPMPFNYTYFGKQWSRQKRLLLNHGLVYPKQTLYSFRHTAAIDVFRRTKDVYMVQKIMGHSSVVVTLKYLRSLGEFNTEELKAAAPVLW